MPDKLASLRALILGKQKKKPAKKTTASKLKKAVADQKRKASTGPSKAAAKTATPKAAKGASAKVPVKAAAAKASPPVKAGKSSVVTKPAKIVATSKAGKKGGKGKTPVARVPEPTLKDIQQATKDAALKTGRAKGKGSIAEDAEDGAAFDIAKISERALRTAATEGSCREVACENAATSSGYCRLHYIKNWKRIKRKELLLREGKLNRYIEELVSKYPDKYIEAIRQDLSNDGEFNKVITELELDEAIDDFDADAEQLDTLIDSIRKDLDDESDVY